jgi:hypothetical protein
MYYYRVLEENFFYTSSDMHIPPKALTFSNALFKKFFGNCTVPPTP